MNEGTISSIHVISDCDVTCSEFFLAEPSTAL